MTGIEILYIAGAISSIIYVFVLIKAIIVWIANFVNRNMLSRDIVCNVLNYEKKRSPFFTARIKIVYSGSQDNILQDISFDYNLRLPSPFDRFLAWINLTTGYLVCDMAGLTTILGTQHYKYEYPMVHLWRISKYIKYPISFLFGILSLYWLLVMILFLPVGWILLNMGPYNKFSLVSIKESIKIVGTNGTIVELPILLKPRSEIVFNVDYEMGVNAKGFSIDTPYKFLSGYPSRTFRPPKLGNFAWRGKGNIFVHLGSKWRRLRQEYDYNAIIGIGS